MPQLGAAAIAEIVAAAATTAVSINSAVNAPGAPKLAPAKQGAQTPTAGDVRQGMAGMGQGGGAPGIAQTFLTGSGGVNPFMMPLGQNTLLGGGNSGGSMPPPPGMG